MTIYKVTSKSIVYTTYEIEADTEADAIQTWQADDTGELPTYEEWTEKISLYSVEEDTQTDRSLSVYGYRKETQ